MGQENLIRLAAEVQSISIAGMCKNAGKTTVLNYLISGLGGCVLGLTSIGRDGEAVDVVTGTKKPRIYINNGTLVATAHKTLKDCTASREILYSDLCGGGFNTPLGKIVIFRAVRGGFVELAGPSVGSEAAKIRDLLFESGAQKVLIDGALDRKSLTSSSICDAVILSTGASYDKSIDKTVEDTAAAAFILSLDKSEIAEKIADTVNFDRPCVFDSAFNPLHDAYTDPKAFFNTPEARHLYLPGAITEKILAAAANSKTDLSQKTLIAADSGKIICGAELLNRLLTRGLVLKVLNPVKLLAVTVNPVSVYGWNYNPAEFLEKMSKAVNLPVFDVERERRNL